MNVAINQNDSHGRGPSFVCQPLWVVVYLLSINLSCKRVVSCGKAAPHDTTSMYISEQRTAHGNEHMNYRLSPISGYGGSTNE